MELVVLESNSVAVAITKEVNEHGITNLVIGRSSNGALSRYVRLETLSFSVFIRSD